MATDAPAQSFPLLRKLVPKFLQPALRGVKKSLFRPTNLAEPYRTVYAFTQVHPTRQKTLLEFAEALDRDRIPGAVVECGVLDGGTAALMAYGSRATGRPVHLFDSWEGLPETTPEDGAGSMWAGEDVGSPKRVVSVMRKLNIDPARLHFHRGWFHETFPKARIDQIALLHVDGDFYESVRLTLEAWYPKMVSGGIIQIDDYSAFVGCRKAVDDFLVQHPNLRLEHYTANFADAFYIRVP